MAYYTVAETFLRPAERGRQATELPASLVNGLHRLLARAGRDYLFLPIRTMQYLAVVEADEVFFVDGQGGYAQQDGVGGRLIQIAWRPQPLTERLSVTAPVPSEILYYAERLEPVQRRLIGELGAVVTRYPGRDRPPSGEARIVAFRR